MKNSLVDLLGRLGDGGAARLLPLGSGGPPALGTETCFELGRPGWSPPRRL